MRLGEVKKIDPEKNSSETSIGSVKYNYLVIATGGVTNFYGFKNKVLTFFSLMFSYFTYNRSNRLIIGRDEEKLSQEEVKVEINGIGK